MSLNISYGILTDIHIKDRLHREENKEVILDGIKKHIDITKYNIIDEGDSYYLKLKIDYINNNIYELIEELLEFQGKRKFLYGLFQDEIKISSKEELKEKYQVICKNNEKKDSYYIESDGIEHYSTWFFQPFYWMRRSISCYDDIIIRGSVLPIWMWYIDTDVDDTALKLLNELKVKAFKSELSKCCIYEVN